MPCYSQFSFLIPVARTKICHKLCKNTELKIKRHRLRDDGDLFGAFFFIQFSFTQKFSAISVEQRFLCQYYQHELFLARIMARPCSFPLREDKWSEALQKHHEEIRKNQKPTTKTFHATWYERSHLALFLSHARRPLVSRARYGYLESLPKAIF